MRKYHKAIKAYSLTDTNAAKVTAWNAALTERLSSLDLKAIRKYYGKNPNQAERVRSAMKTTPSVGTLLSTLISTQKMTAEIAEGLWKAVGGKDDVPEVC